MFQKASKK